MICLSMWNGYILFFPHRIPRRDKVTFGLFQKINAIGFDPALKGTAADVLQFAFVLG